MGGVINSAGGFLGLSDGPKAPGPQNYVAGLDQLNQANNLYAQNVGQPLLTQYSQGGLSSADVENKATQMHPNEGAELLNALATNPITGSKFAAEQMGNNATQEGLYGQGGQLGTVEGKLNGLYNQGFNLTPEDQTMYGQMSGDIARQFGQQGNQMANSLASRGLSASGAAGAAFSGLAGNQNEQLAQAQQSIAQQRFQNTMGQIGQYQNFVSNLGNQYNSALNQQYGRQLAGAENQRSGMTQAAGLQTGANQQANSANMAASKFDVDNTPKNFMDFASAGTGQGIQSSLSQGVSGNGVFGHDPNPAPKKGP